MSALPNQADVDALRGLLDRMDYFESNDQRARYLLSSNWMRDRDAAVKAETAEKIAEIAEEAADDLDLPVMAEWLDQRGWFKGQLHALAVEARRAGGQS